MLNYIKINNLILVKIKSFRNLDENIYSYKEGS